MNKRLRIRLASNKAFEYLVILFAFLITIPLFAIIFYVLKTGLSKISWHFLTNIPMPVGETGGGIANALLGSLLIVLVAAIIAVPIGILCGVYLSENKTSKLAYWSRLAVDVMQGTPSIVIGIVIYFWVVKPSGSFSAISGSIALAIMMLPIVIRSTEETLKLLPSTLKEAGLALGLPYHKVILRVIIPCGVSGILSGVMLAVARIAGETAPLLFTAFGNPYITTNVLKPMQSLPLLIFNYATSPYDEWHDLAWGGFINIIDLGTAIKYFNKADNKKMESTIISSKNFNAYFGSNHVVKNVSMDIPKNNIVAVMGPSGCGKTTYLRCINRMHELIAGATADGEMLLRGEDIYAMNPIIVRLKIGMVFQRPNPFPNLSIYDNVIAGYKLNGMKISKSDRDNIVQSSLEKAALWNEVKDTLHRKGTFLSGGQQQRLCIARAIAMEPEVLLMDEPTSALDPISTSSIEELMHELKKNFTLVIVTHNMQQAARVSDKTAFFFLGELVEYGETREMFINPKDSRTQNYITGRFS